MAFVDYDVKGTIEKNTNDDEQCNKPCVKVHSKGGLAWEVN